MGGIHSPHRHRGAHGGELSGEAHQPNAKPVHDILHSFLLTALVDGRRFAHVERLREDPTVTELFGLRSVVGEDTINRLFGSIDEPAGADLGRVARAADSRQGLERLRQAQEPVGLQRLLRPLAPGERPGRAAAAARLQPLDPVCKVAGAGPPRGGGRKPPLVFGDRR